MGQVIWTQSGLDDLADVMDFVARDSSAYAARLGTRLVETPRVLARWPRSGSIVPEFDVDHVREVIVRPYRVIYVVRGDDCFVVAVVHGARDLAALHTREHLEELVPESEQEP